MRLINNWSYACAKGLADALKEDHKKRSIYYFSFQLIIGDLSKTIILIIISLILGVLFPTFLILLSFVSLRMIAGGYHMDSQGKCLYVTLGLFMSASLIAKYSLPFWNNNYIAVLILATFLIGIYILGRYAPKDTPNKPLTDTKIIKKFKALSIICFLIWLIIIIIFNILNFKLAVISLCFGVLLELFVISHLGHKFFDYIKDFNIHLIKKL